MASPGGHRVDGGVTRRRGCAWTASSNNTGWLTVTSGASGTGNGTVAFSAAANATTRRAAGTLTIGGQTFTVNQAAAVVQLHGVADEPIGVGRGRAGSTQCHGTGRVCVDGVSNERAG